MPGRLVTIATFELPAKARLAQNVLEAAGIKSTVADEAIVSMDWLLGGAVGWVKVQVMEEDAERAVAALEESLGKDDEPVDQEALAAEAEAAAKEDGEEPPEPSSPQQTPKVWNQQPVVPSTQTAEPAPAPEDGAEAPRSERDEYVRRFFLASIFGLIVPLLWFYAVYLFLNAAFGEGPLSAQSRTKLRIGGALLALGFFVALFFIRLYGDPFP